MTAKLTRSQERVFSLLQQLNKAVSAQSIYSDLRNSDRGVGLATVYRSLDTLKLQGLVRALTLSSGETVYSLMPTDKHHLNCLNCGKSEPIHSCPVHNLGVELNQTYDFKVFYHTLEFFGLCSQCKSEQLNPEAV
jgi:Fur family transcriptional regulator, ferric uptake regulator